MLSYAHQLLRSAVQRQERRAPYLEYSSSDPSKLCEELRHTFRPSFKDDETGEWISSKRNPNWLRFTFSNVLRNCMSRTSANGIAGRGEMFVWSRKQAEAILLGVEQRAPEPKNSMDMNCRRSAEPTSTTAPESKPPPFDSVLDVGAGDGAITSRIAALFRHVYATEDSAPMRYRLTQRGYEVLNPSLLSAKYRGAFDVVCCLNVLDRCDTPVSLLRDLKTYVKPNGLIILAVVLPWCPFVECGTRQGIPSETLPMTGGECCKGATFTQSLNVLWKNVLSPMGFELVRWTQLPYLSEGSGEHEYFALNDAVFVLRSNSGPESAGDLERADQTK